MNKIYLGILVFLSLSVFCGWGQSSAIRVLKPGDVVTGAEQIEAYLPLLKGKKVGLITNPSGRVKNRHLLDTLLSLGVQVVKVFSPEHGFRGTADAGEKVHSHKDAETGLPIVSLYGKHMKPNAEEVKGLQVLVFDIQDVGVRFYTYISTMVYCMETAAEQKIPFVVLDRPNPNGFFVDGPVLDPTYKSFLGLHAVPLVYGMTIGEYAKMVNGESWLKGKLKCKLTVVPLLKYDHLCTYDLPVKPSPNLPNLNAILMYPGLGLFEGTIMSVGRGTDFPFQVIGHPDWKGAPFTFTPRANAISKKPKYEALPCLGLDLRSPLDSLLKMRKVNLQPLMQAYKALGSVTFMEDGFNFHAGNADLKRQLEQGSSEEEIRKSWEKGILEFKKIRKKYLLYPDFE